MTEQTMDILVRAEILRSIRNSNWLTDLESISPPQKEIDERWKVEIERRVEEGRSGKVKTIPGEQVFAEIKERFPMYNVEL